MTDFLCSYVTLDSVSPHRLTRIAIVREAHRTSHHWNPTCQYSFNKTPTSLEIYIWNESKPSRPWRIYTHASTLSLLRLALRYGNGEARSASRRYLQENWHRVGCSKFRVRKGRQTRTFICGLTWLMPDSLFIRYQMGLVVRVYCCLVP